MRTLAQEVEDVSILDTCLESHVSEFFALGSYPESKADYFISRVPQFFVFISKRFSGRMTFLYWHWHCTDSRKLPMLNPKW